MNDNLKIFRAIKKINPNAKFTIGNSDLDTLQWIETTPISKADIEAQFPAVELDMAMSDLRSKRNQLLIDTDFHALSDNTMSSDMTTYRQELRDITEGITTVEQANAVVFPTKP